MTQTDYARHDRITLTGIAAKGYHGVLDFEKRDGQPFVVDATLYSDFSAELRAGGGPDSPPHYERFAGPD